MVSYGCLTAAMIFSLGGTFRKAVYTNYRLVGWWTGLNILWFALLYTGPSYFTCFFRVNCDDATSQAMKFYPLQWLNSTFMGFPFTGGDNIFSDEAKRYLTTIALGCAAANIAFHRLIIYGPLPSYFRRTRPHKFKGEVIPA
eukprot:GHVN01091483.1.p1 GENE.GHVN01091483.1~~GHVN01091483.1.p1  ORF type:complete len:142 (+),score=4.53 GHVN01091483.1:126-551(+)